MADFLDGHRIDVNMVATLPGPRYSSIQSIAYLNSSKVSLGERLANLITILEGNIDLKESPLKSTTLLAPS